jgi:hypothetical protein
MLEYFVSQPRVVMLSDSRLLIVDSFTRRVGAL